jgi:endo-1,4-beta-xylanase
MKKWTGLFIVITCFFALFDVYAGDDNSENVTAKSINARIAKHRMGDIIIKTKARADLKIQQVRHEFYFGTAIPNSLAECAENPMSAEDRETYLKILAENFNYAVHENALKWYDCEKEPGKVDYAVADRIYELCAERNIPMRGHCIFWAKDKYVMDWLKKLNNADLRAAVKRRAIGVTKHFKGRITEFDLNNEMIYGDFFRRRLGYGIINEMAYLAKFGNPDVKLYLNDYAILDMGYNRNAFIMQLENLLANGVPIDGIGCQGHKSMRTDATVSAERTQNTLDILAKYDLPIKITECLFAYQDEQVQADELKKLLPIYFAHPSVEAVLMWGFWAGDHWQPHCAMWREDWTPRPQVQAYRDLVYKEWWTQITDKADKKGEYQARAFYGDYIITSNGVSKAVTLSKKDGSIEVTFE